MSTAFLLTSLVIVASPGTGVLFTLAAGLSRGRAASLVAAFGCTLGILPHLAAAITGLAALLHASAVAFETIKVAGVAYLLWMAWATLGERGALTVEPESAPAGAARTIRRAILVNILNPKLSLFFVAFLPQFLPADDPAPTLHLLSLSAVFMALTFAVFAVYGFCAAAVRDHIVSRPRVLTWMRRSFAAAFVGLGAKLALTDR